MTFSRRKKSLAELVMSFRLHAREREKMLQFEVEGGNGRHERVED